MVTWLVALVPETSIKYIMAWVGGWVAEDSSLSHSGQQGGGKRPS